MRVKCFRNDCRSDRLFTLHTSGRIPGLWGLTPCHYLLHSRFVPLSVWQSFCNRRGGSGMVLHLCSILGVDKSVLSVPSIFSCMLFNEETLKEVQAQMRDDVTVCTFCDVEGPVAFSLIREGESESYIGFFFWKGIWILVVVLVQLLQRELLVFSPAWRSKKQVTFSGSCVLCLSG